MSVLNKLKSQTANCLWKLDPLFNLKHNTVSLLECCNKWCFMKIGNSEIRKMARNVMKIITKHDIMSNAVSFLLRQPCFYEISFLFQKTEKNRISVVENTVINIFHLLCSAALGVGFYGNNKTQDGMKVLATSTIKIYDKFDLYKFEVSITNSFLNSINP